MFLFGYWLFGYLVILMVEENKRNAQIRSLSKKDVAALMSYTIIKLSESILIKPSSVSHIQINAPLHVNDKKN